MSQRSSEEASGSGQGKKSAARARPTQNEKAAKAPRGGNWKAKEDRWLTLAWRSATESPSGTSQKGQTSEADKATDGFRTSFYGTIAQRYEQLRSGDDDSDEYLVRDGECRVLFIKIMNQVDRSY